jgi:hypothetical protein
VVKSNCCVILLALCGGSGLMGNGIGHLPQAMGASVFADSPFGRMYPDGPLQSWMKGRFTTEPDGESMHLG